MMAVKRGIRASQSASGNGAYNADRFTLARYEDSHDGVRWPMEDHSNPFSHIEMEGVKMVLAAGFEPATSSFGGKHSIHLSYASLKADYII